MKLFSNKKIRTRFAPSPTGLLHIGVARTALFNYLFAQKNNGVFVLRIEDTDKERSKPEFETDITNSLEWLGTKWDEFYKQSERKEIYKKYLEKLLKEKKSYFCFCSSEELEAQKQEQESRGAAPKYSGKCKNLSEKEVRENINQGKKAVIRLKVPEKKVIVNDLVRGKIEFDTGLIGDIVIAKDLETPLYNFSVVVDDFEMKITHIFRGEDILPNTPKQIIVQEALGIKTPKYGHLPMILAPDKSKLSKRHGAVSVTDYKNQGYLPEAILNMIAFLGWNPGTEKEIYSMKELIKDFSVEKIQKSGAVFNIQKLDYLNGYYVRKKSIKELAELCKPYLPEADIKEIEKIIPLYQERIKKLSEITELTDFLFKEKLQYDKELLRWKKMGDREVSDSIDKLLNILSKIEKRDWTQKNIENDLQEAARKESDRGILLWPLRVALTGKKQSAGPFEIAAVLGREKTIKRLEEAKEIFNR